MGKEAKKMVVIATIVVALVTSLLVAPIITVAKEEKSEDEYWEGMSDEEFKETRWGKYAIVEYSDDPKPSHQTRTIALMIIFIGGIVTAYLMLRDYWKAETKKEA